MRLQGQKRKFDAKRNNLLSPEHLSPLKQKTEELMINSVNSSESPIKSIEKREERMFQRSPEEHDKKWEDMEKKAKETAFGGVLYQ